MNASSQGQGWSPAELAFLQGFFGSENTIGNSVDTASDQHLGPLLEELRIPRHERYPIVLPRRVPGEEGTIISYTITWSAAQSRQVAEVIRAFVGYSFSDFDGRPSSLNPADPVEQAIHQLVGPNLTFKIQGGQDQKTATTAWNLLILMLKTIRQRPRASLPLQRSVSRLLEDFDVALAAGDITHAGRCLDRIIMSGGLTDANLARLRARLLVQQGRDADLLNLPGLRRVVGDGAPEWLRDALLAALYRSADPVRHWDAGNPDEAWAVVCDHSRNLPLADLLAGTPHTLGAEALSVWVLNALLRHDQASLSQLVGNRALFDRLFSVAGGLADTVESLLESSGEVPEAPSDRHRAESASITTWRDLIRMVADGNHHAKEALRDRDAWSVWDPPVVHDSEIADFLLGLDDVRADQIWSVVGPFVEADDYREPAWRSAREFLRNALINDRFTPADVAGIVALTEIVLRGAPDRDDYTTLLNDLGEETQRWVGPEKATVALDLADLLVRAACPDPEARLRLAIALLQPLSAHQRRLKPEERAFARQLSTELGTELNWPDEQGEGVTLHRDQRSLTMLLYSLDEAVLKRTEEALKPLGVARAQGLSDLDC